MKQIYLILLAFAGLSLNAQTVTDHSVVDCNGNQNSIYQVLSTGTPLIVASKGFDCSICVSRAPGWGTWATNNSSVEVWGAMTNTYSANTPSCAQVNNWVNTHGWSNIFTFVDANKFFFEFGTPRYIVYDPADSSIAYEGGNQSTARSTALSLVNNTISVAENPLEVIHYYYQNGSLEFKNIPEGNTQVDVYNLAGKKERSFNLNLNQSSFPVSDLPKGIYLLRLTNSTSALTRKIVVS